MNGRFGKVATSAAFAFTITITFAFALALAALFCGCEERSLAGTDAGNTNKVAGVLVDGEGKPVPGLAVALRSAGYQPKLESDLASRPAQGAEWIGRTGPAGEYAFTLASGDTGQFALEALAGALGAKRASFHRAPGEGVELGTMALEPASRISGAVSRAVGDLGDAWVTLPGTRNQAYFVHGSGSFAFDSVPAGEYTLRVEGLAPARQAVETKLTVKPGETLAFPGLAPGEAASSAYGAVLVRLVRPGNAGGTLMARLSGSPIAVKADTGGALLFQDAAPGQHTLSAWGENPSRDTVRLAGIEVRPGKLTGPVSLTFKIKALIVDGIDNHDWQRLTRYHSAILKESGLFEVAVSTTPPDKSAPAQWALWNPRFADHDVVILHCNSGIGDDGKANPWPDSIQARLEAFISRGGGLVNTHFTFPAFLGWPAFEQMHGLLWKKIDTKGPSYRLDQRDSLVPIDSLDLPSNDWITPGGVGELMGVLNPDHPINKGLPTQWRHAPDHLVYRLKGSPQGMTVLEYAINPVSGDREPQAWTKTFGSGRVFTNALGDLLPGATDLPIQCAGYQTLITRGAEWAATGKVTSAVPADFPGRDSVSLRNNLGN